MPDGTRFFVDAMLGNVAKKLRLFGYDSRYDPDAGDPEILKISAEESRIVITRDRALAGRCSRLGQDAVLVSAIVDREQVMEVFARLHLGRPEVSGDTARCAKCNGITQDAPRQDISGVVPPGILEANTKFWRCTKCGKVYWEGTHLARMRELAGVIK